MAKGYRGESCAEAIRTSFTPNEVVSFSELVDRTRKRGAWTDETIWQDLMALVVNLPPARRHWPNAKPSLFLRPDGRFELFDAAKHPAVVD